VAVVTVADSSLRGPRPWWMSSAAPQIHGSAEFLARQLARVLIDKSLKTTTRSLRPCFNNRNGRQHRELTTRKRQLFIGLTFICILWPAAKRQVALRRACLRSCMLF
jgi:hypothetical protein